MAIWNITQLPSQCIMSAALPCSLEGKQTWKMKTLHCLLSWLPQPSGSSFPLVWWCVFSALFNLFMSSKCNIVSVISRRGFVLIRLSWAINCISMTLTDITALTRTQQGYFFCFRWESKDCVPQDINIILVDIFIRLGASKSGVSFNL